MQNVMIMDSWGVSEVTYTVYGYLMLKIYLCNRKESNKRSHTFLGSRVITLDTERSMRMLTLGILEKPPASLSWVFPSSVSSPLSLFPPFSLLHLSLPHHFFCFTKVHQTTFVFTFLEEGSLPYRQGWPGPHQSLAWNSRVLRREAMCVSTCPAQMSFACP